MFDVLPITESKHCSPIEIISWRRLIIENSIIQLNYCLFVEAIQSRHLLLACTCRENSSVSCSRNIIIVQGKLLSLRKQARHFAQKTFYIKLSLLKPELMSDIIFFSFKEVTFSCQ